MHAEKKTPPPSPRDAIGILNAADSLMADDDGDGSDGEGGGGGGVSSLERSQEALRLAKELRAEIAALVQGITSHLLLGQSDEDALAILEAVLKQLSDKQRKRAPRRLDPVISGSRGLAIT